METTLPRLFRKIVREHPDVAFQMSRFNDGHFEPTTYKDAYDSERMPSTPLRNCGTTWDIRSRASSKVLEWT